MSKVDKGA